jgi:hypothetical protein
MPPTYSVRAEVIDIRRDAPRATDRFLVDTNVWVWEHYPSSRYTTAGGVVAGVSEYESHLERTRSSGAVRYRLVASLLELASVIEQLEHAFYTAAVAPLDRKEYRHNIPGERARVVAEIQKAWGLIEADSDLLPITLDQDFANAALLELAAAPVDGYDALLLQAMRATHVTQLLSDDGDFCCVDAIELFTANPRVLAAAAAQGRLVVR